MTAEQLAQCLKNKSCPVIVDVRSGFEYQRGHIPGAIHLPFLKAATPGPGLPEDRSQAVVITCEHGPRAHIAMGLLRLRGYQNLCLLEGHMNGWRRAGFPLKS